MAEDTESKIPRFTILYNTMTSEPKGFIGTAWEFYKDDEFAKKRCVDLRQQGKFPTLRPFHYETDVKHMNAADRYWIENSK